MSSFTPAEQELLHRTQAFVSKDVLQQAARWQRDGGPGLALLPEAAAIGLLSMQLPPSAGGQGVSFACKAEVAEVIAAADFGTAMALINTHNVAEQVHRLARPELSARLLPELISGRVSACTALTEPDAGSDFAAIRTQAVLTPDGWRINGRKTWITNAAHASWIVVYAQTRPDSGAAGIAAFLIDARQPGFIRQAGPAMGPLPSMGTGGFELQDYLCPADQLISQPGQAFKDILVAINGARAYVAAMCCGMLHECLGQAALWGGERQAFGQALQGHQGWRWRLAEAATDLDAARLLVQRAAQQIDADIDAQDAAARAKVFATGAAQRHIAAMAHAMGAEGLTPQRPFMRHLQAAQVATLVDGSTEMLLERIARQLQRPRTPQVSAGS